MDRDEIAIAVGPDPLLIEHGCERVEGGPRAGSSGRRNRADMASGRNRYTGMMISIE